MFKKKESFGKMSVYQCFLPGNCIPKATGLIVIGTQAPARAGWICYRRDRHL